MLTMKVNETEYKIRFGFRALSKANVLKEVTELQKSRSDKAKKREQKKKEIEEEKKRRETFPEHFKDVPEIEEDDMEETIENIDTLTAMMNVIPKIILAGLQKDHEEYRCDYDNEEDVKEKTDRVIDLVDDYMDEEDSLDIMDLFSALVDELFENGFLSKKSEKLEKAMENQNATVTPTDHLPPQN